MEISIPEVQGFSQSARFYKDDTGRDMIEISQIGSKDTLVKKVAPDHMARFKPEWDAFCDGRPVERRKGVPLTDLRMTEQKAEVYIAKNVHTMDELAALTDGQCQALGHGTLTDRTTARKMLAQRKFEQEEKNREYLTKATAAVGPVPAEKYAAQSDLEATNQKIDALADSIKALVVAMTPKPIEPENLTLVDLPRKPGRPKKDS